MSVYNFPLELKPNRSTWTPVPSIATARSPFTGTTVEASLQGEGWMCSMTYDNLSEAKWRNLSGFHARLRGGAAHQAFLPDFSYTGARGNPAGSPLTATGNLASRLVTINGFDNSVLVFRSGDRFTVYGRMYMVTHDANAVGGSAVLEIFPHLRQALSGDPVILARDQIGCTMKPVPKGEGGYGIEIRPPDLGSVTLDWMESLPP